MMDPEEEYHDSSSDLYSDDSDDSESDYDDATRVIRAVSSGRLNRLKEILHDKSPETVQNLVNLEQTWDISYYHFYMVPLHCYKLEMEPHSLLELESYPIVFLSNVVLQQNVEEQEEKRRTMLVIACYHGHYDVVEYLIEDCQVDVNKPDGGGIPPLWHAVCGNHKAIVELLLSHGAKIWVETAFTTAFHLACFCGNVDIFNTLLEHIEGITLVDKFGLTPMIAAAVRNQQQIVERLIDMPVLLIPSDMMKACYLLGAINSQMGKILHTIKFWKLAINERIKNNELIDNSSIYEHAYVTEITNFKDIDKLYSNRDQCCRQNILVFYKILGPLHSLTISSIMTQGRVYALTKQIDNYIELWNYMTYMQDALGSNERCYYGFMIRVFKYIEAVYSCLKYLKFHELMKLFVKAVSEVKRLNVMMVAGTNHFEVNSSLYASISKSFESILVYTLHIAVLITNLKSKLNDTQYNDFFNVIRELVDIDARGFQDRSIMHLSNCRYIERHDGSYAQIYYKCSEYIETSSLELMKILLDAGGNPNDLDKHNSTPLHYAGYSFPNNTAAAKILLDGGAHLDSINLNGMTYEKLLNNSVLFYELSPLKYTTLSCLAARVINATGNGRTLPYNKKYFNLVPTSIRNFISRHP